jgi:hypothetical protein
MRKKEVGWSIHKKTERKRSERANLNSETSTIENKKYIEDV